MSKYMLIETVVIKCCFLVLVGSVLEMSWPPLWCEQAISLILFLTMHIYLVFLGIVLNMPPHRSSYTFCLLFLLVTDDAIEFQSLKYTVILEMEQVAWKAECSVNVFHNISTSLSLFHKDFGTSWHFKYVFLHLLNPAAFKCKHKNKID